MKKVLITGSAGFLGQATVKRYLDMGCTVVGVDNYSTGLKNKNRESETFKEFELDIAVSPVDTFNSLIDDTFDLIINLACPASPPAYQKDPVKTLLTNVVGTNTLLKLAQLNGSKFFQASTSEIYGDPITSPQKESDWGNVNCFGPRSCYDEGKRAAETLVRDYSLTRGVDARIVRIFNTYGRWMRHDDGRVVTNFIIQALRGEPITIYGDGKQTRSFCYVDDLVDGFVRLIDSDLTTPVNLGNPDEFTMLELAETVLRLTNSKSELIYMPLPGDDPRQRKPDITKAKTHLDWEPKINLETGLNYTIDYLKAFV